jgi:hypothetical protein
MSIYLVRTNSEGICWCSCPEAIVVPPGCGQAACPWCGCGWLFDCMLCHKAFTFAKAVKLDVPYSAIIQMDRNNRDEQRKDPRVHPMLRQKNNPVEREREQRRLNVYDLDLEVGKEYVYLDGRIFSTDTAKVSFTGIFAQHDKLELPQIVHRNDKEAMSAALGNRDYWLDRDRRQPRATR